MSKNKKIVSVDPGTGAGALSDAMVGRTLPCSAHEKKKISKVFAEINGIADGGLRPMRECFTNDEVLPEGSPLPPFPAFGDPDLNIAEQYPTTDAVPAETVKFIDHTVKTAVENTLGLDLDEPTTSGEPTAVGAALSDDVVKQIMQSVPGLSEEDVRSMEEDEIQLFTDLLEMNAAMKEVAVDLQKSADQGGPSSVVGFFRFYMALTKIGVNELAAQTGIIRLRLTSILQETVDMTPGEMTKIKEVLLPRYMRWKELQDRPENKARLEAREKKRMEKKRKKSRSYDPITGMAR